MSEGSDLPITQLSSDIAQAKREKLERENQQLPSVSAETENLSTSNAVVTENSAFQPVAKRQKISTTVKTRPKSAVSPLKYSTQSTFNYFKQNPKSLPSSPAMKKSNKMPSSPSKLSPLLETNQTNLASILRPRSAPKGNQHRPKSVILKRTLSTPEVCELDYNKRHTIAESTFGQPKESVRLRVRNFESLSLQNIRVACDSLSSSPSLSAFSGEIPPSTWTTQRHSVSSENLSTHSSHELGSNKSRINLNKNSNNANHISPSLRNTDNKRLIENVQAYIQRLESLEKDRDDVIATSPRKMPCTLPEQEMTVSAMKKIFEQEDTFDKSGSSEDELATCPDLNLNCNNNNSNIESEDSEFLTFPYIMETQETDC